MYSASALLINFVLSHTHVGDGANDQEDEQVHEKEDDDANEEDQDVGNPDSLSDEES